MRNYIFAATAAILSLSVAPLAASAQDVPSYAQGPGGDEQIRGRVVNFDGAYAVSVRDDRGFVDNVELHQGTIINPTGLTIEPGMVVSILGYNAGNVFDANEIDTPYTYYNNSWYYGGHPYNYYGPTIGFDFFFGNAGWWHGNDFNGGYRYNNGIRVWNRVNVTNIYRGGSYNGRNYVATQSHGGYAPGQRYIQSNPGAANHVYNGGTTTHVYNNNSTHYTTQSTTRVYNGNHTTQVTHGNFHPANTSHGGGAPHGGGTPHGGGHDDHR